MGGCWWGGGDEERKDKYSIHRKQWKNGECENACTNWKDKEAVQYMLPIEWKRLALVIHDHPTN